MSAAGIARMHYAAAKADALAAGESDVRSELLAASDNVDPDTD